MTLPALTLRRPELADKDVFLAAHEEMAEEDFEFGLGLNALTYPYYLARLAQIEAGRCPFGRLPAVFLLAEVGGVLVGRTSIRFELDEAMRKIGGHIGYCVLPAHRRRGHATEILRQSLVVARYHGVRRALLTCDETNVASRRVIEACGGELADTDGQTRRYWIG
jgi:predicted acetyltransferase